MPVENVNTIKNLNEFYPASTDPVLEGDDHLRLIKGVLKNCFPNIDGQVTATHTELNDTVAFQKNVSIYSKTALLLTGPTDWRAHLGLGTAALEAKEYFAPMMHGHHVDDVIGAVGDGRAVTANTGVGVKRPGDANWSTTLDLTGDLEVGLRNTGVTAGTYGSSTKVPRITVDAQGRITSASSVDVAGGGGNITLPNTKYEVGTYHLINTHQNSLPVPSASVNSSTWVITINNPTNNVNIPPHNSTWRHMGVFAVPNGSLPGFPNDIGQPDTPVYASYALALRLT